MANYEGLDGLTFVTAAVTRNAARALYSSFPQPWPR
jgi:hypothetical protein